MELLVAVVLAGLLTLSALGILRDTWSTHSLLVVTYQREAAALVDEIRRVHPYGTREPVQRHLE